MAGISGFAAYFPRFRVRLEDWCNWTGADWPKVDAVVGRSFRMCGRDENVYTMAASAVLRLIRAYDVDPRRVGFLGFGTESSTDNAAGAVILKGMVDRALERDGLPPLSRHVEVPEFKHACLGGVYGLKSAVRYLRCDGAGRVAIVASGDIAEYARGSSGEQTQGAGAVAMLLEDTPTMFDVDLAHCGSAADYRGVDFRKPFARHFMHGYEGGTQRPHDFPVFNGRYSTICYIDAVVHALDDMFDKLGVDRRAYFDDVAGIFMHRPYHRMPIQAMAAALVWGMGRSDAGAPLLTKLCEEANADEDRVREQIRTSPRLFELVRAEGPEADPFQDVDRVVRKFRSSDAFRGFAREKLGLGADRVRDLGNLYTASLPAWIAAGLEDARDRDLDLVGHTALAIGYGSGDAAEAIPLRFRPGWRDATAKIRLADALATAVDLDRTTYEALHDGHPVDLAAAGEERFIIEAVGERNDATWQDIGVEYYGLA